MGNNKENEAIDNRAYDTDSTSRTDSIEQAKNDSDYANGLKLTVIVLGLLICEFLVALDVTIIGTAIPSITDEFHRLQDVGWYGSAFFLTYAVFQSFWGKAYQFFPLKPAFICTIILFEIGSLVCATAPSSSALIAGRAVAGWGAAGIISGCYSIVPLIARPALAPALLGLLGMTFTIAGVAGPLLGGAFAGRLTWRWCFYVNLPVGGFALLIILLIFRTPGKAKPARASWKEVLLHMDPVGTVAIVGGTVCYFLALQWGGISKAWSSPAVIVTLILWILLTMVFVAVQYQQGEYAHLVPRIFRSRVVTASCVFTFFTGGANFLVLYFLPIYFQAAHGASPVSSGVHTFPLILAGSLTIVISSALTKFTRYFAIHMILSGLISTIGAALFYTMTATTSAAQYIGFQIVVGVGIGLGLQIPIIASQAFSEIRDIPVVTCMVLFFQIIAGGFAVSAAESIFENRLLASAAKYASDVTTAKILSVGASEIDTAFTGATLDGLKLAYVDGLQGAFLLAVVLSGLSFVAAFLAPWKSLPHADAPAPSSP